MLLSMKCFLWGLDSTRNFLFQAILIEGDSLSTFAMIMDIDPNYLGISLSCLWFLVYGIGFGVDVENAHKSEILIALAVDLGVY